MDIGIDVGTVATKGINSEGKRVIFPSHVAAATELILDDVTKNGDEYTAQIKAAGRDMERDAEKHFVGDLALREGRNVAFDLDRDKHLNKHHDVLLLTAARLLASGEKINIAVDLPLGYYRQNRNMLARNLAGISSYVSVNRLEPSLIEFGNIQVYPQGVGALFTLTDALPETGLAGVVDPGGGTTEYLLVEIRGRKAHPVSSLSDSVEMGTYNIYSAVSDEYKRITGGMLDTIRAEQVVRSGKAVYRGREIDMSDAIDRARRETARVIADNILAAWKKVADTLRIVYIVGGGALEMPSLASMLPAAKVAEDPQWANVEGILAALTGKV